MSALHSWDRVRLITVADASTRSPGQRSKPGCVCVRVRVFTASLSCFSLLLQEGTGKGAAQEKVVIESPAQKGKAAAVTLSVPFPFGRQTQKTNQAASRSSSFSLSLLTPSVPSVQGSTASFNSFPQALTHLATTQSANNAAWQALAFMLLFCRKTAWIFNQKSRHRSS